MEAVNGVESSERALKAAHAESVANVLRTPLASLEEDLKESSRESGSTTGRYIEQMRERFDDLVPGERRDTPTVSHLNSVLVALSRLVKTRAHATRSASSPLPPPAQEPQHPADA